MSSSEKGNPKVETDINLGIFGDVKFQESIRKLQQTIDKEEKSEESTPSDDSEDDIALGVESQGEESGQEDTTFEEAVEKSRQSIRKISSSILDLYRPSEEIDKLAKDLDTHLRKFLNAALEEFDEKTNARLQWSKRIWGFTLWLIAGTLVLILLNYVLTNIGWSKPIVTEKLLYVFVGGMFAQIISLMIIIMKYVFSPSKDVYTYLTELVKVRKLKNGYGDNQDNNGNTGN